MDVSNVTIKHHAVKRFCQRNANLTSDPEEEMKRLLSHSFPEDLGMEGERRLLKNRYVNARYYRNGNWRFVLCNDVVVTVERCFMSRRKRRGRK